MDGDKILEEVKVFGALNAQMEQLVSLENEFLRGTTARILLAVGPDPSIDVVALSVVLMLAVICRRGRALWTEKGVVRAAIDQQKKLLLARHLAASKPRPPPSMLVPPASVRSTKSGREKSCARLGKSEASLCWIAESGLREPLAELRR